MLLIAGRSASLSKLDQERLEWRASKISFGAYKMSCMTLDGILHALSRRSLMWGQTTAQ